MNWKEPEIMSEEPEYSPFFIGYDGLGEPGDKYQRWHFVDYLRKHYNEDLVIKEAADRTEALEKMVGFDVTYELSEPYAYYPKAEPK